MLKPEITSVGTMILYFSVSRIVRNKFLFSVNSPVFCYGCITWAKAAPLQCGLCFNTSRTFYPFFTLPGRLFAILFRIPNSCSFFKTQLRLGSHLPHGSYLFFMSSPRFQIQSLVFVRIFQRNKTNRKHGKPVAWLTSTAQVQRPDVITLSPRPKA
jgi:hypothetical protein